MFIGSSHAFARYGTACVKAFSLLRGLASRLAMSSSCGVWSLTAGGGVQSWLTPGGFCH